MLDEFDVTATFFVVADVVEHYQGLAESIVSVNSLYNKTDSSLEGVSSYPYYPKKKGLEIGEEKERDFIEFPWAYWNDFDLKEFEASGLVEFEEEGEGKEGAA